MADAAGYGTGFVERFQVFVPAAAVRAVSGRASASAARVPST
ncbi:hypothetical protein ABZ613_13835 [Streptomyces collinus]